MRKIWLWSLVAGVVVLSGCGILPQEEKVLSGDISQTGNETELSPAEALSWKEAKLTLAEVQAQTGDTTPIVVITEANSGAIVTQTGDSLIYRNEVYGFQVKLGKETRGSKLFVNWDRNGNNNQPTFLLYGKEEAERMERRTNWRSPMMKRWYLCCVFYITLCLYRRIWWLYQCKCSCLNESVFYHCDVGRTLSNS